MTYGALLSVWITQVSKLADCLMNNMKRRIFCSRKFRDRSFRIPDQHSMYRLMKRLQALY